MNTLAIFLLSSFAGSLIGMTGWRLWTQRTPNQQPEHQVSDDLPDSDCRLVTVLAPVLHSQDHSAERNRKHA